MKLMIYSKKASWAPTAIGVFIAVFLLAACGDVDNITGNDRQKFIDVYIDLSLAYWKTQGTPDNYQALAAVVFQKYDIDKAFMIKIQKKFENKPKLQLGIYQEIVERLKGYEDISQDSLKQILDKAVDLR